MRNNNVRTIVFNALIAAIYVAITLAFAPLSYDAKLIYIEVRISEILVLLAFFNSKYAPGLIIGCFIANLFSPLGWYDLVFGTSQTALTCLTYFLVRKLPLNHILKCVIANVINALHCGIIIGLELTFVYGTKESFIPYFLIQFLGVFVGELLVLMVGTLIFNVAFKNKQFKKLMAAEY